MMAEFGDGVARVLDILPRSVRIDVAKAEKKEAEREEDGESTWGIGAIE